MNAHAMVMNLRQQRACQRYANGQSQDRVADAAGGYLISPNSHLATGGRCAVGGGALALIDDFLLVADHAIRQNKRLAARCPARRHRSDNATPRRPVLEPLSQPRPIVDFNTL